MKQLYIYTHRERANNNNLNHVAAVDVGGHCLGVLAEAPEDELDVLRRHPLYALLDHTVCEPVAHTLEHFVAKPFGHRNLLVMFRYFKDLEQR